MVGSTSLHPPYGRDGRAPTKKSNARPNTRIVGWVKRPHNSPSVTHQEERDAEL